MDGKIHHYSYKQVSPILNEVVEKMNQALKLKKIQLIKPTFISNDITFKQTQSIEQIRASFPKRPQRTTEDKKPPPIKAETIRPFSAKVKSSKNHQIYFQGNKNLLKHNEKRSSLRGGVISMRSLKSLKGNEKGQSSEGDNKFIPLGMNDEDTIDDDQVIEKLRLNKLQAQEYEVKKQKFLETISRQNEAYFQNQLKFVSSMGKKDYTYNYNGCIVETKESKKNPKKLKKVTHLKSLARSSEVFEENDQAIYINYKRKEEKENISNRDWILEEQENIAKLLCYKSQNIKYTIKQ